MSSAKRINITSIAVLAALSWMQPTLAEEAPPSASAGAVTSASPSSEPSSVVAADSAAVAASTRRSPFGSRPVAASALAARRGGDRVYNDAQLRGVVADNQASNLTTGMNAISEGAFSGSSGISTVIQNSGNNVLIQNSTIVNVQLK